MDNNQLATGSLNGDIIVWEYKDNILVPLIYMIPCLNQRVVNVTVLQYIPDPILR